MKLFGKYRSVQEMVLDKSPTELNRIFPHGRPMTRRDLLKSGALSFAASITLPSVLELLIGPEMAQAQAVCAQKPTFVGLKLNGGAAMMGNWVAMGSDRDFIETYSQLGLGPRSEIVNRTVSVFGNSRFFDASQFLAGIRATATQTTLDRVSMVGIPVASTDDSANNAFDITYFISKLGLVGSILPNLGQRQSLTGIQQLPALSRTPPTPLAVGNVDDIANALTVTGSIGRLSGNQKGQLFSMINRLSESQARSIASASGGSVLQQLVSEATATNANLVSGSNAGIDPMQDQAISAQYNTAWATAGGQNLQNQNANSRERVFGTMVYNTLKGNAGVANLEMGGYDYHGNGRAAQDAADLQAGRIMGQVLESAAIMNRPLMLMVTSDGAVGAPAGSEAGAAFTGDRGQGGAILLFAFDPVARPLATDKSGRVDHQVGQVRGQAGVDTTFLTGNDPSLAGLAAFANFASFSGQIGQFGSVVGGLWNNEQIDMVTRLRRAAG